MKAWHLATRRLTTRILRSQRIGRLEERSDDARLERMRGWAACHVFVLLLAGRKKMFTCLPVSHVEYSVVICEKSCGFGMEETGAREKPVCTTHTFLHVREVHSGDCRESAEFHCWRTFRSPASTFLCLPSPSAFLPSAACDYVLLVHLSNSALRGQRFI